MPHANTSFLSALTREIPKAWPFFTGIGAVGVGAAVGDGGVPGAAERAVPLNSLEDARVLAGALRDMETKRSASARMMTKNADDESRL